MLRMAPHEIKVRIPDETHAGFITDVPNQYRGKVLAQKYVRDRLVREDLSLDQLASKVKAVIETLDPEISLRDILYQNEDKKYKSRNNISDIPQWGEFLKELTINEIRSIHTAIGAINRNFPLPIIGLPKLSQLQGIDFINTKIKGIGPKYKDFLRQVFQD